MRVLSPRPAFFFHKEERGRMYSAARSSVTSTKRLELESTSLVAISPWAKDASSVLKQRPLTQSTHPKCRLLLCSTSICERREDSLMMMNSCATTKRKSPLWRHRRDEEDRQGKTPTARRVGNRAAGWPARLAIALSLPLARCASPHTCLSSQGEKRAAKR